MPTSYCFDISGNMELDAVSMLAALGHKARLALFRHLVKADAGGIAAGELADFLGVPPSTLSHHLAALERAGLISARRDGRNLFYHVEASRVRALIGFLTEDCCGGEAGLCLPPPASAMTAP